MGLIVAPSCNDCHGVHDIKRGVDRESPINHANVAKTCGKCHVGIEEIYNKSVHGQLLAKGDKRGPVCTDCHTAHEIETPKNGHFKMASDQRCGKCHEDRLEHYRDTYHGKAMALGKPNVASGGRRLLRLPRPPRRAAALQSRLAPVSKTNILATCQQCHPERHGRLHRIQAARQPAGRQELPAAARGVPGHDRPAGRACSRSSACTPSSGCSRVVYLYLHDSKKFREAKIKHPGRTTNGSPASRRSSASCISWW